LGSTILVPEKGLCPVLRAFLCAACGAAAAGLRFSILTAKDWFFGDASH